MSGGIAIEREICGGTDLGTNTAATSGIALTTSYTTVIASAPFDVCWMDVQIVQGNFSGNAMVVDLAVGGAGSEVVFAKSVGGFNAIQCNSHYSFPVRIPAGTRISAKVTLGSTGNIIVRIYDGSFTTEGGAGIFAENVSLSSLQGTAITPNATAHVKGSYATMVASTTYDYVGFLLAPDSQNGNAGSADFLTDIAIGGAGSEQIIIPNIYSRTLLAPVWGPYWIQLPAATRVAARCQYAAASGTAYGLSFYGIIK